MTSHLSLQFYKISPEYNQISFFISEEDKENPRFFDPDNWKKIELLYNIIKESKVARSPVYKSQYGKYYVSMHYGDSIQIDSLKKYKKYELEVEIKEIEKIDDGGQRHKYINIYLNKCKAVQRTDSSFGQELLGETPILI